MGYYADRLMKETLKPGMSPVIGGFIICFIHPLYWVFDLFFLTTEGTDKED